MKRGRGEGRREDRERGRETKKDRRCREGTNNIH